MKTDFKQIRKVLIIMLTTLFFFSLIELLLLRSFATKQSELKDLKTELKTVEVIIQKQRDLIRQIKKTPLLIAPPKLKTFSSSTEMYSFILRQVELNKIGDVSVVKEKKDEKSIIELSVGGKGSYYGILCFLESIRDCGYAIRINSCKFSNSTECDVAFNMVLQGYLGEEVGSHD